MEGEEEEEGGGETDYFLLRPGSLFVVLLLSAASLASVASSHSLEIPPPSPHQMTKTSLRHALYGFSPQMITRSPWPQHSFPLMCGKSCGFLFHRYKRVNIYALTCSYCFFPKRLFSNWKPLSLVTLKTVFFPFQMNRANECTSSDCGGSVDRRVGSEYGSLKGAISRGGYSTLQSVLYRAAELRCIWRSSLGRLMAHCEENVPRRDRTEIKWAASLPSLV